MAIVWPCPLTPHDYASAGEEIEVARPDCPDCGTAMSFHGSYRRPLRLGIELRLVIRRARCVRCRSTHALLPDFVVHSRFDGIEAMGAAIEEMARGATAGRVARSMALPYTTVRDWRRRFASRAEMLTTGFLVVTVAFGGVVTRLLADPIERALRAIASAVGAARRRLGAKGPCWRVANRIIGGQLLAANTDPPWIVL